MALSKKQRHDLKLAEKRRSRRAQPSIGFAKPMKVSNRERSRLTETNPRLMLRLETLLVEEAERDDQIDDSVIASALRCVVQEREPETELVEWVVSALVRWQMMEDQNLDTDLAMRVIYQSARTHSDCQQGDYGYLIYASSFVKSAIL